MLWNSVLSIGILLIFGIVFSVLVVLFLISLLIVNDLLLFICIVVDVCCVVISGRIDVLLMLVVFSVMFVCDSFDIFGVIFRLIWLLVSMVGVNFSVMLNFFFCSVIDDVLLLLFCGIGMKILLLVRNVVFWLLIVMRFGFVRILMRLLVFCVLVVMLNGWLFVLLNIVLFVMFVSRLLISVLFYELKLFWMLNVLFIWLISVFDILVIFILSIICCGDVMFSMLSMLLFCLLLFVVLFVLLLYVWVICMVCCVVCEFDMVLVSMIVLVVVDMWMLCLFGISCSSDVCRLLVFVLIVMLIMWYVLFLFCMIMLVVLIVSLRMYSVCGDIIVVCVMVGLLIVWLCIGFGIGISSDLLSGMVMLVDLCMVFM